MIRLSGTLESVGPNPSGVTSADATNYMYNSMQVNASTNATTDYLGDGGPNPTVSPTNPLVDAINHSNDTSMLAVPTAGTIADGGPNA